MTARSRLFWLGEHTWELGQDLAGSLHTDRATADDEDAVGCFDAVIVVLYTDTYITSETAMSAGYILDQDLSSALASCTHCLQSVAGAPQEPCLPTYCMQVRLANEG